MIGIFQLIDGDTGERSSPMQCTDLQLLDVIEAYPEKDTDKFQRSYVLCMMHKLDGEEEWQYSLFPLMLVEEYRKLFSNALAEVANG